VGYEKVAVSSTKPTISPNNSKIQQKLVMTAYIKSYMRNRQVPCFFTTNDLAARFKVILAQKWL